MNTNRLFIGDLYYNDGLESIDTYKIDLIEKDVLLVKFGNRYIRANYLKNKFDLISLYTILKRFEFTNNGPLINYMYKTKISEKGTVFVDRNSLRRYSIDDNKIDYKRFKTLSLLYDFEKYNKEI